MSVDTRNIKENINVNIIKKDIKQDKTDVKQIKKVKKVKKDKVYNLLDLINKNWQTKIIKQLIRDTLISNLKKCNIKYNEFFTDEIVKNEMKIIDNIIKNLDIENINLDIENINLNIEEKEVNKNIVKKNSVNNNNENFIINKKNKNNEKTEGIINNSCLDFNNNFCNARVFDNNYIITSYKNKIIYGRQCKNKKNKNNLCSIHNKNLVHGLFNKEPSIIIKKHFEKEFESKNNYMFAYLK